MKSFGATCPSLPLPQLFARDEIETFISIDSGLVPVANSFNKKLTILGSSPTWEVLKMRQFCQQDFLSALFKAELCSQ